MKHLKISVFAIFCFFNINVNAQNDWFSFDIPPLDTSKVEFYPTFNQHPIGNEHFLTINANGAFEINGELIRFWGTPCSRNESASLSQEDYPALIKELKKNGVNILRFHLWDSETFNPGTSIFGTEAGTRTLDDDALERIDYLIALMKENGIYAYIDLLCDRHYTAEDGVYSADSTYNAAKIVNFFDPKLIELQKEYAEQLLTHVNPYTGNALVNEPAMAFIDIVNEGWFLHALRSDQIKPVNDGGLLSQYHFNMLTDNWNNFLMEKYTTTDSIKKAWGIAESGNEELIQNGSFESGGANWGYWGPATFSTEISSSTAYAGTNSFHVNSTQASANNYDCQLKYNESFFVSNTCYELSFWAKSNVPHTIGYTVQLDTDPWTSFSSQDFTTSSEWEKFSATFSFNLTDEDHPFLFFNLGLVSGDLWIDSISVKPIYENSDQFELLPYNSLTAQDQRSIDQVEFYLNLLEDYYDEMYSYLKNDLNVQIPVTGSNFLIGIPDVYTQRNTDFVDNHGYWDHYENPVPVSMISETDFYNPILGLFAGVGISGKPLTVSEYNYENPNPFSYEALFFLAGYGSFYDAGMLIVHQLEYTTVWDQWNHGFNSYQQISYRALQPTFAYAYRNHLISTANTTIAVDFSTDDVKNLTLKSNPWENNLYPDDYPFELAYQHKLTTSFELGNSYNPEDYPETPSNPFTADTQEIEWDSTGLFSINTPELCAFVGDLSQFTNKTIGAVELTSADQSAGFTLLSLDNRPLEESEKMLMTLTTEMKNTGMITNGYEVIDYGSKPRIVKATSITINLTTNNDSVKVIWLDESGQQADHFEIFRNNGHGEIPITINTYEHPGVWFGVKNYELKAPIAGFSADTTTGNAPLTVQFTNECTDATAWSWDFDGDGMEDAQEQNPLFEYTIPGVYTVSLTAKNSVGEHTKTKTDYITVNEGPSYVDVTFQVDLQNETVSSDGVFLRGTFNNWISNNPLPNDGSIYYKMLNLEPGAEVEYKFINGDEWENLEEGSCTITTDDVYRFLKVPDKDTVLKAVCFNSCDACSTTSIQDMLNADIFAFPNPTDDCIEIVELPTENLTIDIYNVNNQHIRKIYSKKQSSLRINLEGVIPGIYFIKINGNFIHKTLKVVKK
ncbi:MAG TPA: carbohydrate binding domain-containing protein [Bacteroidales bacterium]|nr:carbohydrate binding domain-containing protein [Bacteroidales bacterium]